jgi:VanZ family protein
LLWRLLGHRAWQVLLAGVLYGFFLEVYQGVMPINRSFEIADGLADTVGTVIGVLVAEGWFRLKK